MKFYINRIMRHPAYHELINAGEVFYGSILNIDDETAKKILEGKPPLKPIIESAPIQIRPKEEIEGIDKICMACDWFSGSFDEDGGRCEHSGCKTCPGIQRGMGGLRNLIGQKSFICPAGKWR